MRLANGSWAGSVYYHKVSQNITCINSLFHVLHHNKVVPRKDDARDFKLFSYPGQPAKDSSESSTIYIMSMLSCCGIAFMTFHSFYGGLFKSNHLLYSHFPEICQ